MPIDTANVTDRRSLRFNSLDDLLTDARDSAAADREGSLRRTGNWSVGQTFTHIAAFMNYPYDGYPTNFGAPWFIRLLLRPMKNKFLRGPLPAGRRIPGTPGGTIGVEDLPTDEALRRLETAVARLRANAPAIPNVVFGPMTHDEWITLHLRHAELHFSFLHPK